MDSKDINQGYEDAFLGIQKYKMDDQNQDPMALRGQEKDKIMKQRNKQEKKQQVAYEKHLVEMKKNRELLPKPIIDRKIRES